jgi:hypothetical protein
VKAHEEELEREWLWLVEAQNTVAPARAEQGDAAFQLTQAQAMRVGQRRVEASRTPAYLFKPLAIKAVAAATPSSWAARRESA